MIPEIDLSSKYVPHRLFDVADHTSQGTHLGGSERGRLFSRSVVQFFPQENYQKEFLAWNRDIPPYVMSGVHLRGCLPLPSEEELYETHIAALNDTEPYLRFSELVARHPLSKPLACRLLFFVHSQNLLIDKKILTKLIEHSGQQPLDGPIVQMVEEEEIGASVVAKPLYQTAIQFRLSTSTTTHDCIANGKKASFMEPPVLRSANPTSPFSPYREEQPQDDPSKFWPSPSSEDLTRSKSADGHDPIIPYDIEDAALKEHIDRELSPAPNASEAQRKFLFYAKKYAQQLLALHPESNPEVSKRLQEFINEAAAFNLDDHLPIERMWKEMTDSFLEIDESLFTDFQDGTWECSEITANTLRRHVATTRQAIADRYSIFQSQKALADHLIHSTLHALDNGIIQHEFAGFRTPPEIACMQRSAKQHVVHLISAAISTEKTTHANFLRLFPSQNPEIPSDELRLAVFKARYTSPDQISITLASPIGCGTYKTVWKVVKIAGTTLPCNTPAIYAYATFPKLKRLQHDIRSLHQQITIAQHASNFDKVATLSKQMQARIALALNLQENIEHEATIAKECGEAAIWTRVVRKQHDPSAIKGLMMQYVPHPLYHIPENLPLKIRVEIAHRLCWLVSRLHAQQIVHLDLKSSNFLYIASTHGLGFKLADFGTSKKLTGIERLTQRVSTYPPPETVQDPNPSLLITTSMDVWALGLTVIGTMYGESTILCFVDQKGLPLPTDNIFQRLDSITEANPHVNDVIKGMIDPNPQTRWTVERAMTAFRELAEKM